MPTLALAQELISRARRSVFAVGKQPIIQMKGQITDYTNER